MEEQAVKALYLMHNSGCALNGGAINGNNDRGSPNSRGGSGRGGIDNLLNAINVLSAPEIPRSLTITGGFNEGTISVSPPSSSPLVWQQDYNEIAYSNGSGGGHMVDQQQDDEGGKRIHVKKRRNSLSSRCQHCESTGTPEWRRGPRGDRTLCNACGLFYAKLIKRYGETRAIEIMFERKQRGDSNDRRISIG